MVRCYTRALRGETCRPSWQGRFAGPPGTAPGAQSGGLVLRHHRSHIRGRRAAVVLGAGLAAAALLAGCSSDAEPSAAQTTPSSQEPGVPAGTGDPATPAPEADGQGAAPDAAPPAAVPPATATPRAPGAGVADGLAPAAPAAPVPTLPPQPFTQPTVQASAAQVTVTGWRSITTPAGAPGEIAGPGVAFDVVVRNTGSTPLDLSNVVADLRSGADQSPLLRADREPTVPFSGTLAPGQSARATYAFNAEPAQRADVTLFLSLNAETPTVVFRGNVRQ